MVAKPPTTPAPTAAPAAAPAGFEGWTDNMQNYYKTLYAQQNANNETLQKNYEGKVQGWQDIYNAVIAERDKLYKANMSAGDIKRKEAMLKGFVGAMGNLIDAGALSGKGIVPVRDTQTGVENALTAADASDTAERGREEGARRAWLDKLTGHADKYPDAPKFANNDILGGYWKMLADMENQNNALAQRAKEQAQAAAKHNAEMRLGYSKLNAQEREARETRETRKAAQNKPFTDIYVKNYSRNVPLSRGDAAHLFEKIVSHYGVNNNDPDIRAVRAELEGGGDSNMAVTRFISNPKFAHIVEKELLDMKRLYYPTYTGNNGRANADVPAPPVQGTQGAGKVDISEKYGITHPQGVEGWVVEYKENNDGSVTATYTNPSNRREKKIVKYEAKQKQAKAGNTGTQLSTFLK